MLHSPREIQQLGKPSLCVQHAWVALCFSGMKLAAREIKVNVWMMLTLLAVLGVIHSLAPGPEVLQYLTSSFRP